MAYDIYDAAIAELSLSGSVGLGRCSRSTAYRWARIINQRLLAAKCEWSVKLDLANRCIDVSDVLPADALSGKDKKP